MNESANPFGFGGFAVGQNGEIYAGINDQVLEIDQLGNRTLIYQFAPGGWLATIQRFGNHLYFADGSTNTLWRRDLTAKTNTSGSTPPGLFDLAVAPTGQLVASANAAAENSLWLVDFAGGQHREIVTLTGPSGPLQFDAAGNLYYADQVWTFPTPPGAVQVLRFDAAAVAAAIAGGPPLQEAAGTPLFPGGLDGAFDMAWDDRGRLYISDPGNGGVLRTLPGSFALDPVPFVRRPQLPATEVVLQLQFIEAGAATFDAFQPETGGAMFATFADFFSIAEVHRIRTERPVLVSSPTATAPPGPVVFVASGLPASGVAALCVSALPAVAEQQIMRWRGTPVWSGLNPAMAPLCLPMAVNATGDATLPLSHPGGFGGTLHFLALGTDGPGVNVFATSAVYSLTLVP